MRKLCFLIFLSAVGAVHAQTAFQPPATPRIPVTDTLHGMLLTDPFRWLEDKNDPKVIEWTKAQHDYGINYLSATQRPHPGVREEVAAYINRDYEGPLNKVGKRVFQVVRKKGDKQSQYYTVLDGRRQLIWDPVRLDTSGKTATTGVVYTYDGELAAVLAQQSGSEISTTYFIDTRSGKQLYSPLPDVFGFQFTKDQKHAYVTVRSREDVAQQRPLKTYLWALGEPFEKAVFLGTTADPKNSYYVYDNRYGDVSFFGEADFYANKLKIKKTGSNEEGKLIYESKEARAYPEAIGNKLYILTNDKAPNYRFLVGDVSAPDYKNWKTLIPEGETVMQDVVVTKSNLIVQDKKDVQSRLFLYDLNGKKIRQLALPEVGDVSGVSYNREEDSVYLALSTFTSPAKVYVASPQNFAWRLFYTQPSPVDMSNAVGEIKFYTTKDGNKVPVFLVHRKDLKMDSTNPVLLTAYGGFQAGIAPRYYGFYAAFINRGGVVAEPGIRGGDEYGEKWHQQGMLGNKQNVFDDFFACAEWLVKEGYTKPSKMVAMGASNGGLLMGAAATQRPDLFKAIVCGVPLLDMVRYHKFLIARYWIPEYGSAENEADFRWLLRYSPYHNIRAGINLPPMLVTAGAYDSRVDPLHAKKFVAALQNNPGQLNPVLLHMDYNSGHGPGQSTQQMIDNYVFEFEFIMNQLGMDRGL